MVHDFFCAIDRNFTTRLRLRFGPLRFQRYAASTSGKLSFPRPLCRFKSDTDKKKKLAQASLSFYARSTGFEPATSPVTGECSNQLSYDRIILHSNK
jgi:hypothetical protein